jgi:hypothetical protein
MSKRFISTPPLSLHGCSGTCLLFYFVYDVDLRRCGNNLALRSVASHDYMSKNEGSDGILEESVLVTF